MGSFKRNGRSQGPNRRRNKANPKRQGFPKIESLEERRLLTGGGTTFARRSGPRRPPIFSTSRTARWPTWAISSLRSTSSGSRTEHRSRLWPRNSRRSSSRRNGRPAGQEPGRGLQPVPACSGRGHEGHDTSSYYGLVDGWAPINALPSIAEMAQTEAGQPLYYPVVPLPGSGGQRGGDLDCSPTPPCRNSMSPARA